MGINIESARKRLYSNYGVGVERYSNDKIVDEFEDKLETILSFGLNEALPAIITGTIALFLLLSFRFFL